MKIDYVEGTSNQQVLTVSNHSEQTLYLNVDPYRFANPGSKQQKLIPLKRAPLSFGLIVNPRKLIIPPHQSRYIKVIKVKSPEVPITQDVVYRINVTPSQGDLERIDKQDAQYAMGLKIVLAYGVRVVIRPMHAHPEVKLSRQGKQLTIKNTGNTTLLLRNGRQCPKPSDTAIDACHLLDATQLSKRLYAGNTWQVTLPDAAPVYYDQYYLDVTKAQVVHSN